MSERRISQGMLVWFPESGPIFVEPQDEYDRWVDQIELQMLLENTQEWE